MNQDGKIKKYYRFHSGIYDATRWLFLFNRKKAIEKLKLDPNDLIIDFACGTGLNIRQMIKKTKNISAIDFSEEMLNEAKKKYPGVNFFHGDACNFSFKEKADKIICTYSISLIENWKEAIKNMAMNLNENGTLVILDFYQWKNGFTKLFYPVFKWWLNIHNVNPELPVEQELKKYFKNVEMKTYLSGYNFIAIANKKLIRKGNDDKKA